MSIILLPSVVLISINEYLEIRDIISLLCTCKILNGCLDDIFWRQRLSLINKEYLNLNVKSWSELAIRVMLGKMSLIPLTSYGKRIGNILVDKYRNKLRYIPEEAFRKYGKFKRNSQFYYSIVGKEAIMFCNAHTVASKNARFSIGYGVDDDVRIVDLSYKLKLEDITMINISQIPSYRIIMIFDNDKREEMWFDPDTTMDEMCNNIIKINSGSYHVRLMDGKSGRLNSVFNVDVFKGGTETILSYINRSFVLYGREIDDLYYIFATISSK